MFKLLMMAVLLITTAPTEILPTEMTVDFGEGVVIHTKNAENIAHILSTPDIYTVTGTTAVLTDYKLQCASQLGKDMSLCNIAWGVYVSWCYGRAEKNYRVCIIEGEVSDVKIE